MTVKGGVDQNGAKTKEADEPCVIARDGAPQISRIAQFFTPRVEFGSISDFSCRE